jgi:type 2 lantibiotic (TIGR03893 family)
MKQIDMKEIVGESFEDMSLADMVLVQGSGDITPNSTVASAVSISVSIIYSVSVILSKVDC